MCGVALDIILYCEETCGHEGTFSTKNINIYELNGPNEIRVNMSFVFQCNVESSHHYEGALTHDITRKNCTEKFYFDSNHRVYYEASDYFSLKYTIRGRCGTHSWSDGKCTNSLCTATCDHTGNTTPGICTNQIKCSICQKTLDATGHTPSTKATCAAKAVCSVCNEQYGEVNANNHTGREVWETTNKKHTKEWDFCNAVSVAEANHSYENGICKDCGFADNTPVTPSKPSRPTTPFTKMANMR